MGAEGREGEQDTGDELLTMEQGGEVVWAPATSMKGAGGGEGSEGAFVRRMGLEGLYRRVALAVE